jgi:uncharacterized OsmC-like protein
MTMTRDDLRSLQEPLRARYREDVTAAALTLSARAEQGMSPLACAVDLAGGRIEVQAHAGVGGPGTEACSGDLLLGALAACAQITCQMVATAAGVRLERLSVRVKGDMDLRGTLGMSPRVPVGFSKLRLYFDLEAPDASPARLAAVQRATEQYCVVLQTLQIPPQIEAYWSEGAAAAAS